MIMKKNLLKTSLLLFAISLFFVSCNEQPKTAENKGTNSMGQTATVEVGVFDAVKLKDQIVGIIKTAPAPVEVADFTNKVGVSYMSNLTVPTQNVEKYLTAVDQSLAMGMYKFDLFYAKAYNRKDVVQQLLAVQKNLGKKLGMEAELAKMNKFDDRIKKNENNTDSLNAIVMAMMNEVGASLAAGDHPGIYALSYVGANIEAMYILTQVALMSKNNTPLVNFLGQQKERTKANYSLLEMTAADAAVAPIFEKMKPIMDIFNNNQTFTSKQLAEMAPLVASLRAGIVK